MKSPKELAAEPFTSGAEQTKRATSLRRLAGGIRPLANQDGLTDKEKELLVKTCALLEEMATARKKAAALKSKMEQDRAKRESEIRFEMKDNFEALGTVAGKVALVAAIRPYLFTPPYVIKDAQDASYLVTWKFRDCLESVASSLASSSKNETVSAKDAVAAAWKRFEDQRASLEEKHALLIRAVSNLLNSATDHKQDQA